jgi:hypothetical protein
LLNIHAATSKEGKPIMPLLVALDSHTDPPDTETAMGPWKGGFWSRVAKSSVIQSDVNDLVSDRFVIRKSRSKWAWRTDHLVCLHEMQEHVRWRYFQRESCNLCSNEKTRTTSRVGLVTWKTRGLDKCDSQRTARCTEERRSQPTGSRVISKTENRTERGNGRNEYSQGLLALRPQVLFNTSYNSPADQYQIAPCKYACWDIPL